jgi:CheY-like chemotaxis protein
LTDPIGAADREIVIVEDEQIVALDIRIHLQRFGYRVRSVFSSGEEYLHEMRMRAAAEDIPDLVLMDINLQGAMDGITAAGITRDEFRVPVILLTALQTTRRSTGPSSANLTHTSSSPTRSRSCGPPSFLPSTAMKLSRRSAAARNSCRESSEALMRECSLKGWVAGSPTPTSGRHQSWVSMTRQRSRWMSCCPKRCASPLRRGRVPSRGTPGTNRIV